MSAQRKLPEVATAGRINIFDSWQARYWCLQLNCSERQLRTAVRKVGDNVKDVRLAILRGAAG